MGPDKTLVCAAVGTFAKCENCFCYPELTTYQQKPKGMGICLADGRGVITGLDKNGKPTQAVVELP